MRNMNNSEVSNSEIRKNFEERADFLGECLENESAQLEEQFWNLEPSEAGVLHEDANGRPPYDLGERSALFGEEIIRFAKKIPRSPVNDRLISQLVGAGT